jgi:hypothetical protein
MRGVSIVKIKWNKIKIEIESLEKKEQEQETKIQTLNGLAQID